jgi:hypothetical protein
MDQDTLLAIRMLGSFLLAVLGFLVVGLWWRAKLSVQAESSLSKTAPDVEFDDLLVPGVGVVLMGVAIWWAFGAPL